MISYRAFPTTFPPDRFVESNGRLGFLGRKREIGRVFPILPIAVCTRFESYDVIMNSRILAAAAVAVFAFSHQAAGDSFTLKQTNDNDTIGNQFVNYGQSFTPSVGGESPSPVGVGPMDTVYLTAINFRHGRVEGAATRYLNIYSAIVHINPSTSVAVATPIFVGSSTNQVDASGIPPGGDMIWSFDGLPLMFGHEYYAAFSTTATPGDIAGGISLAWHGNAANPYAGGSFLHNTGKLLHADVYFVISLDTTNPNPVPEPSTLILLAVGVGGMLMRRRNNRAA